MHEVVGGFANRLLNVIVLWPPGHVARQNFLLISFDGPRLFFGLLGENVFQALLHAQLKVLLGLHVRLYDGIGIVDGVSHALLRRMGSRGRLICVLCAALMLVKDSIAVYFVLAEIFLVFNAACVPFLREQLLGHLDELFGVFWRLDTLDARPGLVDDIGHELGCAFHVESHIDLLLFLGSLALDFFPISARAAVEEYLNFWSSLLLGSILILLSG